MDYDFRLCKACAQQRGTARYRIGDRFQIYVCGACGFHYIDHLDDLEALSRRTLDSVDRAAAFEYVETRLQYDPERAPSRVRLLSRLRPLTGARCLDIGAGGGLFLDLMRRRGAEPYGIEPDPVRRLYARERHALELRAEPVENAVWQGTFHDVFDFVTLWDVLEHVNFPIATLDAALALVKPGGWLVLDTPTRESAYHRLSVWSYRLSGGRVPLFLPLLYSDGPFAHKQILSSRDLRAYAK
ncbi:MAG: class I SAM-dependent methyltransferase, partial [Thermoanaerobaculia bacterium]